GPQFWSKHFGHELRARPLDVVATLTYFTALSITNAYRRFILDKSGVLEIIVSGGGALNPMIMKHLQYLLDPVPVRTIADFGVPALAKEPALIALMAFYALHHRI